MYFSHFMFNVQLKKEYIFDTFKRNDWIIFKFNWSQNCLGGPEFIIKSYTFSIFISTAFLQAKINKMLSQSMKNEKLISNSFDALSFLSMMYVSIFIALHATLQIISFSNEKPFCDICSTWSFNNVCLSFLFNNLNLQNRIEAQCGKIWKAEENTLNENEFGFHWQQSFSHHQMKRFREGWSNLNWINHKNYINNNNHFKWYKCWPILVLKEQPSIGHYRICSWFGFKPISK